MAVDLMDLAKAFAGPAATIIAASTAAWITYRLGREQVRIAAAQATTAAAQAATAAAQKEIAQSQRDIAYDRLKYDLFEKRYEIYLAAKELIEHVSKLPETKGMVDQRIVELKVKLIEARFFYPPTEATLFAKIAQLASMLAP